MRAGLHEQHRIVQSLGRGFLVATEGHIGDDPGVAITRGHAPRVIHHVRHGYRQRALVALNHHAQRVTHQQNVDARLVQQA
jgi:hypothetical protein